jgi:hypothetical protein
MDVRTELAESIKRFEDDTARKQAAVREHAGAWRRLAFIVAGKLNVTNVWTDGHLNLSVTGDKHALTALIGILRRQGFDSKDRPQPGQTSYSALWTNADGAAVYIMFASTSCRRVQVGTKTVEQPIYEIVCDEVAPAGV